MSTDDVEMQPAEAAPAAEPQADAAMEEIGDQEESDDDQQAASASRKRSHSSGDDGEAGGEDGAAGAGSDSERRQKKKHKKEHKSKKHKKHTKEKRPGAQFVDDIAVNEDDEDEPDTEESEEDDGFDDDPDEEDLGDGEADNGEGTVEGKKKKGKKSRRSDSEDETMHRALDQDRDNEEMSKLASQIEGRYAGVDYMEGYDEDVANRSSSGAVLPSVRDPSLFILRIGKGEREDDVVYELQKQYYKRELDHDPSRRLHITSVFTTPASRGYIYVEAFREVHVEQAIKSLPKQRMVSYFANSKKNIKVPISEMVAAIKFRSNQATVEKKQWVRFKRGPYKDDLAQVVDVQDQGTIITLKFVPRIDFLFLEAKRKNEKLTQGQWRQSGEAARGNLGRRPALKYFDERELRSLGFPVEKKKGGGGLDSHRSYYHFMNSKFKNGFQFKDVKIDALELEHVNPSQGELDWFQNHAADSDDDEEPSEEERTLEEQALLKATSGGGAVGGKKTVYSQGDRVIIVAGGMSNVTGRITSVSRDRVTIIPDDARIIGSIEEELSRVRKWFTMGSHVKVVAGINKGETGLICNVPEDPLSEGKLALYLDISGRTIEVSSQDLIESSEVSAGRDTFGDFELYELVQLTNDVVGVITKVHLSSFYVLTNTGSVQQVKLQELQKRQRNDRFAHTMDKLGDTINRDDVVTVLTGPERGKQAVVKHIFKRILFAQSKVDNTLFVIRGDQTALVGGRAQMKMMAPRSPTAGARSPGPVPQSPGRSSGISGAPSASARPNGRFQRDPIVGKDVKITGGAYKGYAGVCIDVMEGGLAKVECRAIFRKVVVPRNQIMESEVVQSRLASSAFYGSQTPLLGGATPAHAGFGGATPAHDALGGSMTPAHRGGMTPSQRTPSRDGGHDVWSAQTPAHVQEGIPEENDYDGDEEFRAAMGVESSAQTPLNPMTPGGVPQTPRTPGAGLQTPHGGDPYSRVPATPATPFTPGGAAGLYEDEDEEKAEDVPKVDGIFTHTGFVGCYVLLRGGPAVGIITRIEAGGAKVHVRGEGDASSGVYTQAELSPVQPAAKDMAVSLDVSANKTTSSGSFRPFPIESVMGDSAIITAGGMRVTELKELCKFSEEAAGEEDDEAEKPSKKKGRKSKK